jgi:hypothetical protein
VSRFPHSATRAIDANGLAERLASGLHSPLALIGKLVEVDTSQPVNVKAIAARIQADLPT